MDPVWIGLVGAVLGFIATVIGGVVVGGISIILKMIEVKSQRSLKLDELHQQSVNEEWQYRRSKLEELHLVLNEYALAAHELKIYCIFRLKVEETNLLDEKDPHIETVRGQLDRNTKMSTMFGRIRYLQRVFLPAGENAMKEISLAAQELTCMTVEFASSGDADLEAPAVAINSAAWKMSLLIDSEYQERRPIPRTIT